MFKPWFEDDNYKKVIPFLYLYLSQITKKNNMFKFVLNLRCGIIMDSIGM